MDRTTFLLLLFLRGTLSEIVWKKNINHDCRDRASRAYDSLDAAKKACLQQSSCIGVADDECNGGLFFTCFRIIVPDTHYHSCVYSKVDAATINKCTCTNGLADMKFNCPKNGAESCARCVPGFHRQRSVHTGYMVCVQVQQTTGPVSLWKQVKNRYCYKGRNTYGSLDAAKKGCLQTPSCTGILDDHCDGGGKFYSCDGKGLYLASSSQTCVYKVNRDALKKCICQNGTPVIDDSCPSDGAELCANCKAGFDMQSSNGHSVCVQQNTGSQATVKWTKLKNTFCPHFTGDSYTSLDAAKTACLQNQAVCKAVYDDRCDGRGFHICTTNKKSVSSYTTHSCIYTSTSTSTNTKKQCTCQNGTPAVGDRCPSDGVESCAKCKTGFDMKSSNGHSVCVKHNTGGQGLSATVKWTKHANRFCTERTGHYVSLDAAKKYCLQNKAVCAGVDDDSCDGNGTFQICRTNDMKTSTSHSCVYTSTSTKKECTCQNGTPAVGDSCPSDGAESCAECKTGFDMQSSNGHSVCVKHNIGGQGLPATVKWIKHANRFCTQSTGHYVSLDAAKKYCLQNQAVCKGVYDDSCDGSGTFKICRTSNMRSSNSHSCVYTSTSTKKECTCQNGTPAVGDSCPSDGAESCAKCKAGFDMKSSNGHSVCVKHNTGGQGAVWTKVVHKYCSDRSESAYTSLDAAQKACLQTSSSCGGVYDGSCDGSGTFTLCRSQNPQLKQSSQNSCVYQVTHAAPVWTKLGHTYCSDRSESAYGSLDAAQKACLHASSSCGGVYDDSCDGSGSFSLCRSQNPQLKQSSQNSCVYKVNGAAPKKCTCTNGIPAVGDRCLRDGATSCVKCNAGFNLQEQGAVSLCSINECVCLNGTPAVGTSCPQDGAEKCYQCDMGYSLDSTLGSLMCTSDTGGVVVVHGRNLRGES